MVSIRLNSLLVRRNSAQQATVHISTRQQHDEVGWLLTRDGDEDEDEENENSVQPIIVAADEEEDEVEDSPRSSDPPPPQVAVTSSSTSTTASPSSSDSKTELDSITSSTSKLPQTTLSMPPILTSTLTTTPTSPPSPSQVTTQRQTNLPLLTISSALPSANSSGAAFVGVPAQETGIQQSDGEGGGGQPSGGSTSASVKVGIAFGVIAAVGLLVGLFWGAILIRRRRRRNGQDEVGLGDYNSRNGRRSRFNFSPKSIPSLPFSFTSPLDRFHKPKPAAMPKRQVSNPFNPVHVSGHRTARSNSSILDEAIQAAYQMEVGSNNAVPQGSLDEKRRDSNQLLPLLDLEPLEEASIRKSVASWFKRSSRHHPLLLNPSIGSSSRRSSWASTIAGSRRSRSGSQATMRTASFYSTSGESVLAEGSGARMVQDVPPLPDLGLQRAYTNNTMPPVLSLNTSTDGSVAAPLPVFTKDDAQAYYKSLWADYSISGSTERMSAMSTWTDVTRTTMGGGWSSAINTPGLSPPPNFLLNSNRASAYPQTPLTPGYTSATGMGEGTRTRDELYSLYAQARGSVPASAVGLVLQQPPQVKHAER